MGDRPQLRVTEYEMNIQIQGRKIRLTATLRTHAERRLGFALARFGERIGRVVLRFSEGDGDRSTVDKCCRIDVGLRPKSVRVDSSRVW